MIDPVCRSIVLFVGVLALVGNTLSVSSGSDDVVSLNSSDKAEIRTVIEQQLTAFRLGEDEKAFSYASPGIQEKFRDSRRFSLMVKRHYPVVYNSRETEFLQLQYISDMWVQKIIFTDFDGDIYLAHYPMERQSDGQWRIDGCILTIQEGKST